MALESVYQAGLIKRLRKLYPGCIILKNDPNYCQGIPDLIILFNDRWATLETKRSRGADKQPNQDYYQKKLDDMSFSAYIHPDNEKEVLDALQSALQPRRATRISQRK